MERGIEINRKLSAKESAKVIGVSVSTVYRWAREGRIHMYLEHTVNCGGCGSPIEFVIDHRFAATGSYHTKDCPTCGAENTVQLTNREGRKRRGRSKNEGV